jgi:HAD superfamily phosphoserine phosphatase-like hydrolase
VVSAEFSKSERVFVFDLDGTLTKEELLPKIAREFSIQSEIEILTAATVSGQISFPESFAQRVKILSQIPIKEVSDFLESCELDIEIIDWIHNQSDQVLIFTGNLDLWVDGLLAKYGLNGRTSKGICRGGSIELTKIMDKASEMTEFKDKFTVVIGDGANDLGAMDLASLGIAFGGVHLPAEPLFSVADFVVPDGRALCKLLKRL